MTEDAPRLHVYLARCGVGSRRSCERYIAEGRVRVDGRTVRERGTRVSSGARVQLDGRLVQAERRAYLALHKPPGYLCSNRSVDDKPLASELFSGRISGRLFHVGRLDFLSSGLVLYTNDGEFANRVTHPSFGVQKEYEVQTQDPIPDALIAAFRAGLRLDGELYRASSIALKGPTRAVITLAEGHNREIRRVFQSFGIRVRRLHRVRVGVVTLRGLPPGAFRPLTARELAWFRRAERGDPPPGERRKAGSQ